MVGNNWKPVISKHFLSFFDVMFLRQGLSMLPRPTSNHGDPPASVSLLLSL